MRFRVNSDLQRVAGMTSQLQSGDCSHARLAPHTFGAKPMCFAEGEGETMERGRRTPRVTVAVNASDPVSAYDTATALRTQPRLRVLDQDQTPQAEALLALAPELDEQTLAVMRGADSLPRVDGPRVVLVAERVATGQLLRAVDHGLVSVLPRSRTGFDQIVLALLRTRGRQADLPESAICTLVSDLRAGRHGSWPGLFLQDLDPHEAEVLRLLAEGLSAGDIALELNCSEWTIKHVILRSCTRLSLRNRARAVAGTSLDDTDSQST
jgi:DNA-binding NarL/FixJ family response regulator